MALRRTVKGRLYRGAVYAVFVIVVVVALLAMDWPRVIDQFFNAEVMAQLWPDIIVVALVNTLLYTAVAFIGGLVLGVVFALMKLSSVGPFRWFATVWIELFRGMPALLTMMVFAFGLPIAFNGFRFPGGTIVAGLVGLMVVASAYMAESIRAGILAVPRGQAEAARSLGMSPMKTMFWVILPQGFRIIVPPLTNEFVLLLKDTSLLFVVGMMASQKELTTFGRDGLSTYSNATPLIMAAIMYLVITIPLTRVTAWLERTLARQR